MATQVTLNSGSVDSAGSLALKTNGTTTAITINSSQGVEFLAGTAALPAITTTGDTNTGIFFPAADTIAFSEGGVEAMRINSSGFLGINLTNPDVPLTIKGGSSTAIKLIQDAGTGTTATLYGGTNAGVRYGILTLNRSDTSAITTFISGDSSDTSYFAGGLAVGTTAAVLSGKLTTNFTGNTINGATFNDTGNGNGAGFIIFAESGTAIGSISRVGTTSEVAYNTISDYRLKTVTGAVTGQGSRIDALKPIDYLWKDGGQQARGFLAHEFQTVYPNSVTGIKDAVDADGNPKHQSMQAATSEVIADLVAEIQSLRKRLAALESA